MINYNKFQKKNKIIIYNKKKFFNNESVFWLIFIKVKNFLKGVIFFLYEILSETSTYLKLFIEKKKFLLLLVAHPLINLI
jgi:hypothetical protein